jgi:hypothetical protein
MEGAWLILENDVLAHPGPSPADLDRSLSRAHPHWSEFRQQLDWYDEPVSAGQVVDDAAFAATFEANSAVVLVTVGLQRDWRLPLNGDLFTLARVATYHLNRHFWDYVFNENNVQKRYPEVANASTYAIYALFDFDQTALGAWCEAYTDLYGQSPLYLP